MRSDKPHDFLSAVKCRQQDLSHPTLTIVAIVDNTGIQCPLFSMLNACESNSVKYLCQINEMQYINAILLNSIIFSAIWWNINILLVVDLFRRNPCFSAADLSIITIFSNMIFMKNFATEFRRFTLTIVLRFWLFS